MSAQNTTTVPTCGGAELMCDCRIEGIKPQASGNVALYMPGLQVVQVLAWHLQLRARLFPRLPSHSQVNICPLAAILLMRGIKSYVLS